MRTSTRLLRTAVTVALAALIAVLGSGAGPAAARPPAAASPVAATAPDGARVVAARQVAPRQVDLTVDSPALGTTAQVRLLTPDGWRPGDGRHWPTLWLLHGCCGDYTSWTAMTDVANIPQLRRVLVVMPEAGNTGFYSDWLGDDGSGRAPGWETFHLRELLPILDASYGGGPDRTVAGLSMGGFGALSYAARHPGMFRAAASYSGVADPLETPGGPQNIAAIAAGEGADADALWGDPVTDRAVWAAHDPYTLAPALLRLPVFLSCGDGVAGPYDPPGATSAYETLFLAENQHLAGRLTALGDRRLTTDFYGHGTHSWPYWQRELHRSLPMLLRAMGVSEV
ncbi:alpha/beta hydrolase [Streptantibioticus silvisoli]|uniref:Alpha/beta hydrolase family protein n=1 Tax=Streptantibioticus silvisoli TaxID=2705255 RepID=A0ABT6VTH4_9ACTN|nr:alpha/beta hydrolase family protein [Streptantibioticus silvisoli]MDI5961777.1 alpha/beta hydrolase family protein [Streptantibioticus silvisoli]